MTLLTPWPALLLLALVPAVWLSHRRVPGSGPRHRAAVAALRGAAVALAALAAAQPIWQRPGRPLAVVYLLDASWSVDPAAREAALEWIHSAEADGRPDASSLLLFGADAVEVPDAQRTAAGIEAAAAALEDGETDLAAALDAARARLPDHGLRRIVLFSDGRATRGELEPALVRLGETAVRVHALPLPPRVRTNAVAAELEVPDGPAAGEPLVVRARVESVEGGAARVEVRDGGRVLAARDVALAPGAQVVPLELVLDRPGTARLELRVTAAGDAWAEDDRLLRAVRVGARPRVLDIEGHPATARYLRAALDAAGFDVTVRAAEAAVAASLEGQDAVILSDLPADALREPFQAALQLFVSEGGGLVLIGGESVYGEEGYAGTRVEAALPIDFRIREEKRDLALMIVLDKSYSMKGPKMELAKEATKAALDLLEDHHRFGVVSFDWDPYVTVPLQPARDKAQIAEAVGRIRASAQTNIFPALEKAFEQLAASDAKVKHVILLSDGRSYPDDYESLVRRMREADITVSTVAVGAEADRELLGAIAAWGDGRRYAILDASRVQQIFVEETRRAVQATLVEEAFRPLRRRPTALLDGLDLASAPPLRGYVSTQPKDAADVLLESETGAPILARWRYGLGAAVAFTSDASDRWASDWLAWPGYGRFWAQVLRSVVRRSPTGGALEVAREGGRARVGVTLRDAEGRPRLGLRLQVGMRTGDGPERAAPLPQVAPGRYETALPLDPAQAGRFRLIGAGDATAAELLPEPPAERRLRPPDAETLGRIAAATGGAFAPAPAAALTREGESGRVPTPLLPWLAGAALLAWLLDVAARRAPWFWRRWAGEPEPLAARPAPTGDAPALHGVTPAR